MATKKVLIIEFNAGDAALLEEALQKAGYKTLSASTGAEGVRQVLDEFPDLVVLNLLMPDLQGIDLIRRIRARDVKVPIVAINQLTAASPFLIRRMGANDQITKPIDATRLLEIVERLIGKADSGGGDDRAARVQQRKIQEEGIPAEGTLKQLPFHLLLGRIFRLNASGVLTVKDEFGEIEISFEKGLPVFVDSEGFARRLVRDDQIDGEIARDIRNRALQEGITEQEAVERMELLPPDKLRDAVRGFGYAILRDLCRPSGSRFSWLAHPVSGGEPLDPAVIIELAAKRHFSPEKITDSLEGKGRALKAMYLGDDPERLPDLAKRPMIQKAVDAALRHRVLGDVLSMADNDQEKITWAVYALGILKIITFNPEEEWKPAAKPPRPEPPKSEPPRPFPERTAPPTTATFARPTAPPTTATFARPTAPPTTATFARPTAPADPEADTDKPDEEESAAGPLSDKRLLRLGRQLLKSKTYSKAQKCFEELLVRRGDDKIVLLNFAQAASRNRFMDSSERLFDSVEALRRTLEIDPNYIDARLELARIFNEAGESDLAVSELEKAQEIDPANQDVQRELRNLLRRVERVDGADPGN